MAIKADLEEAKDPAEFLTAETVTAWPHLSRFHLYRRRLRGSYLASGTTRLEIGGAGGSTARANPTQWR